MAASAACRSVEPLSRPLVECPAFSRTSSNRMNHWFVARKITGLWQRQQCGYWCENVSRCHSRPRSFSASLDVRVRVEDPLAAEQADGVEKMPARTDRRVNLQPVLHAGVEVVGAVTGRRVHRAGAGIERDVVAEHRHRIAVVKRMTEPEALEL